MYMCVRECVCVQVLKEEAVRPLVLELTCGCEKPAVGAGE